MAGKTRTHTTRIASAMMALALGGGLSLANLSTAQAIPETEIEEITGTGGTIVINKRYQASSQENPTGGERGTGAQAVSIAGEGFEGAVFLACRINLESYNSWTEVSWYDETDVLDADWWLAAEAFVTKVNDGGIGAVISNPTLWGVDHIEQCFTGITDSDGQLVFGDEEDWDVTPIATDSADQPIPSFHGPVNGSATEPLPLGLYLIGEYPESEWENGLDLPSNFAFSSSEPFLVTLPWQTEPGVWQQPVDGEPGYGHGEYTVYAYPKNSMLSIEKSVELNVNDHRALGYTIEVLLPYSVDYLGHQNLPQFTITDQFNNYLGNLSRDTYDVPNPLSITVGSGPGAETLTYPQDFSTNYIPSGYNWTVQFVFNANGLAKINRHQGDYLKVYYEVMPGNARSGLLHNTAELLGFLQDDVEVYLGGIKIYKLDDAKIRTWIKAKAKADADPEYEIPGELYNVFLESAASFEVYAQKPTVGVSSVPLWVINSEGISAPQIESSDENLYGTPNGIATIDGLAYSTGGSGSPEPDCWRKADRYTGEGDFPSFNLGGLVPANYDYPEPRFLFETLYGDSGPGVATYFPGTTYWVQEVSAPQGWGVIPEAFPICVTSDEIWNPYGEDLYGPGIWIVVDHKEPFLNIQLPFTGENNRMFPAIVGLVVVVGSFGVYVARANKSRRTAIA